MGQKDQLQLGEWRRKWFQSLHGRSAIKVWWGGWRSFLRVVQSLTMPFAKFRPHIIQNLHDFQGGFSQVFHEQLANVPVAWSMISLNIGWLNSSCGKGWAHPFTMYRIYLCISRPFLTKKSAQKIALDLYTSHTQRPDQAVREISITTAWSAWGKPVIIVVDFHQFSAHSSSIKKCEIINVKWFKCRCTGDYFYCVFWSV